MIAIETRGAYEHTIVYTVKPKFARGLSYLKSSMSVQCLLHLALDPSTLEHASNTV